MTQPKSTQVENEVADVDIYIYFLANADVDIHDVDIHQDKKCLESRESDQEGW